MKIYTKTGDDGSTGLFGGGRVSKASLRVDAYGTVDELNAILGVARCHLNEPSVQDLFQHITEIQTELFTLGAELACAIGGEKSLEKHMSFITQEASLRLETWIDEADGELPPLKNFVLPGGSLAAASLHHARCVARRAERLVVELSSKEPVRTIIVVYLNRLSDLLFTWARVCNVRKEIQDIPWAPRKE